MSGLDPLQSHCGTEKERITLKSGELELHSTIKKIERDIHVFFLEANIRGDDEQIGSITCTP